MNQTHHIAQNYLHHKEEEEEEDEDEEEDKDVDVEVEVQEEGVPSIAIPVHNLHHSKTLCLPRQYQFLTDIIIFLNGLNLFLQENHDHIYQLIRAVTRLIILRLVFFLFFSLMMCWAISLRQHMPMPKTEGQEAHFISAHTYISPESTS